MRGGAAASLSSLCVTSNPNLCSFNNSFGPLSLPKIRLFSANIHRQAAAMMNPKYDNNFHLQRDNGGAEACVKGGRGRRRGNGGRGGQQRMNRPGSNSYLKIVLDETTLVFLNQATVQLQSDFMRETSLAQGAPPTAESMVNRLAASGKPQRPLSMRPRSLDSLHLTLFFGGEVLCALSEDELAEWHSSVQSHLAQRGFVLKEGDMDAQPGVADSSPDDSYFLRVKEFRLFPPRRNHLVVAVFEASPAWHDLYRDLREISKACPVEPLREITKASKDVWVPHITLANVQGQGSAEDNKRLGTLLETVNANLNRGNNTKPKATAQYIGMGGPIPGACTLCWKFFPATRTNFPSDPVAREKE